MNYLFRGKPEDGEWIEGDFTTNYGGEGCIDIIDEDGVVHAVHPESVGMWTGLTDKNEKKIFGALPDSKGGDICTLHLPDDYDRPVKNRIVSVEWKNHGWHLSGFNHLAGTYYFGSITGDILEVIGNMTDNPELMEESE